jgi:hypothetical protein
MNFKKKSMPEGEIFFFQDNKQREDFVSAFFP